MKPCSVLVSLAVLGAGACGGDDDPRRDAAVSDGDSGVADAQLIDAPPDAAQSVVEVTCTGSEPTIVTQAGSNNYVPMSRTIAVNDAIRFEMGSTHNVAPTASSSDPGLVVGFAQTKCLRFTAPGVFTFRCTPHGFIGTVTVN
jgi:plastocyanin